MSRRDFPLRSTVSEQRLDNGLTVLVCEDRRAPVAAVAAHVRAGYFDEPDGVVGISHVLEHMLFKGTTRRGPGDIAREAKALGGHINASTNYDRTLYYTVVPASGLEQALDIQSDALMNSVIDQDELRRELRVIIEEAKRKLDSPAALARETLYASMFDYHRMRRWRIGTERQLERISRNDVIGFYKSKYRAPDIVLCIVGDVEAGRVQDLVERLYGDLPGAGPGRDRGPDEPIREEFRFREIDGDISQTYLEWGWRTPDPLHPDTPYLDLFGMVLGEGRASRLYRGVRDVGLATGIGAGNYTPATVGVFGIEAVTRPEDAGPALDATCGVLRTARVGPVEHAEMDRARSILEAGLVRRFETVQGQASLLAEWQALGSWTLFAEYWDRLMTAPVEDLLRVAHEHLAPERATVLVYRPCAAAPVTWTPSQAPRSPVEGHGRDRVPPVGDGARPRRLPSTPNVDEGVHQYRTTGLRVFVLPRPQVPLVSLAVCMEGGTAEEGLAQSGLTRLMARTSIRGTARRSARELAEETESLGGSIVPAVAPDAFEWSLTLPSKHVERGVEILSDVTLEAAFPMAELERERRTVLSELKTVRDDMLRLPNQLFHEAAFVDHRYGRSLETLESAVAAATRDGVAAWHRHVVVERERIVFIAGDVDPDRAAALSAVFAAGFTRGSAAPAGPAGWPDGSRRRIVTRNTEQTSLVLGFPGPDRNHPDHDTFRVLAAAVAGTGGRLFEELRSRRSLAYAVTVYPIARLCGGAFAGYIATSPEREDEARAGLTEELLRLADAPLPDADVERAKRFLVGSRQIHLQTNGARLAELAGAILLGGGLAEIRERDDRIRAVSPAMILEAAQRWFDVDRIAEGVVRGSRRKSSSRLAAVS